MKKWIIVWLLPALLWLVGCSEESIYEQPAGKRVTELTLNVALPMAFEPTTYAASEAQENQVDSINVLGFETSTKKLLFHTQGVDLKDAAGSVNGDKKSFRVLIPNGTYTSVFLVVIGNAHNEIATALQTNTVTMGMTHDQVATALQLTKYSTDPTANGKWTVKPSPFRAFPMWGRTGDIDLKSASLSIPALSLLRSVARADVEVDSGNGLSNFEMKEVWLGNSMRHLQLLPLDRNIDPSNSLVTDASVRYSATSTSNVYSQIKYDVPNANQNAFMGEVFIPEHAKGVSGTNVKWNCCLVIGGYYNGSPTISYYRVDFAKTTRNASGDVTGSEYLPVMRNHKYAVNITKIKGAGATSVTTAMAGAGVNIAVDVICKSEDIVNIVYDGQYMLGIDRPHDDYKLSNQATSHSVAVSTTFPSGWKATTAQSWITLKNSTQNAAGQSNLTFDIAAQASSSSAKRTGQIQIQAGGLIKTLNISQELSNYIEPVNKDTIYAMNGDTFTFRIKSPHPWSVKIKDDQYNILKHFTTSGTANASSGIDFKFSLVDDMKDQLLVDKTTMLTFYSPTNDFPEVDIPIRGWSDGSVVSYDLGGVWVWKSDDGRYNESWYVVTNTPDNTYSMLVPPGNGALQVSPPRRYSCAEIPGNPAKPWRVPTQSELIAIGNAARTGGTPVRYGFQNAWYWSATSYNNNSAYTVDIYGGGGNNFGKTTPSNLRARCVMSK